MEAVERCSGRYGLRSEGESDLLDVLRGGSEQALAGDGEEAWEAGVAVTVELLGGKLDHHIDPAKQAIPRNQTVETYHL